MDSRNPEEFKLIHWNSRSIVTKLTPLKNMINTENPQVITINETWPKKDTKLNLKGFKIYRKDRDTNGGGVLISVSKILICGKRHSKSRRSDRGSKCKNKNPERLGDYHDNV